MVKEVGWRAQVMVVLHSRLTYNTFTTQLRHNQLRNYSYVTCQQVSHSDDERVRQSEQNGFLVLHVLNLQPNKKYFKIFLIFQNFLLCFLLVHLWFFISLFLFSKLLVFYCISSLIYLKPCSCYFFIVV